MNRRRRLESRGGSARRTISLPLELAERADAFLDSVDGEGLSFSALVSDSLATTLAEIDKRTSRKKVS